MSSEKSRNNDGFEIVPAPSSLPEQLRRMILTVFKPGQKFYNVTQVSQIFHVSPEKAQNALNILVHSGVLKLSDDMNFHISDSLYEQDTKFVGIFITEPAEESVWSIYRQTISVIRQEFLPEKIQIIQTNLKQDFHEAFRQSKLLLKRHVDGIIFQCISSEYEYSKNKEIIELFERVRVPVVLMDKFFLNEPDNYSYVISENELGGYVITQHLLKLGHKRLAFIRDAFSSSVFLREQGFRKAQFELGVRCDESKIKVYHNLNELQSKIDELVRAKERPDAIVAANDLIANEIYINLARHGLRIPQDIAVVGFDDLPHAVRLKPPLTTVRQNLVEMGIKSVQFLMERLQNFAKLPNATLPVELIVRESCGIKLKKITTPISSPHPGNQDVLNDSAAVLKSEPVAETSIGIIYCGFEDNAYLKAYYDEIISGMKTFADQHAVKLIFSKPFTERNQEYSAIKNLVHSNIQGLFYLANHENQPPSQEELVFLFRRRIPFMIFSRFEISGIPCIAVDERYGAFLATEYIIQSNRKHFGLVLPPGATTLTDIRLHGCFEAIDHYGVNEKYLKIFQDELNPGLSNFDAAFRWALELDIETNPLEAILCYNDAFARGIIQAFNERGIQIPGQIAVIGFDDVADPASKVPPLTTIQVPKKDIGNQAIQQIFQQIQKQEYSDKLVFRPELVVRQSG
jgi:DNA-binding LacI/PurR family transcriptional regulator